MLLCFTGTGNSRYAADMIADITDDTVLSLNDVIKFNKTRKFISEKPFVIVAPIYAWRLPAIIEKLLKKSTFIGNNKMYFVVTMGSESGLADKYCEKISKSKGLEFMGLCGVSMPDNYIIADVMPDKETADKKISEAEIQITDIANAIKEGKKILKLDNTPLSYLKSVIINPFFNKFAVTSRNYITADSCISCGQCANYCPVNNITFKNSRPEFGKKCISCYSCIQHCPEAAINIKGKTENHGRYVCPEYTGK